MPHLGKKPQDFYHELYATNRSIVDASTLETSADLDAVIEQLRNLTHHGARFTLLKRKTLQSPKEPGMHTIELFQQEQRRRHQEVATHLRRIVRQKTWKYSQIFCVAPQQELPKKKRPTSEGPAHAQLITLDTLRNFLEGNDSTISRVSKELRTKLQMMLRLLPSIGKIALIPHDEIQEEIENINGSGTLFIDPTQTECGPIHDNERSLIATVHDHYTKLGMFRRRSREELIQLMSAQHVLRIKKSPLGGGSLLPIEDDEHSLMLEGLWAHPLGNGLGTILLQRLLVQAEAKRVLALTNNPDAMKLFTTNGFENYGLISSLKNGTKFPRKIREYPKDHPGRNSHLFVHEPGN